MHFKFFNTQCNFASSSLGRLVGPAPNKFCYKFYCNLISAEVSMAKKNAQLYHHRNRGGERQNKVMYVFMHEVLKDVFSFPLPSPVLWSWLSNANKARKEKYDFHLPCCQCTRHKEYSSSFFSFIFFISWSKYNIKYKNAKKKKKVNKGKIRKRKEKGEKCRLEGKNQKHWLTSYFGTVE